MRLGIGLPSFSSETHAIPPDRFRRYARRADDAGFAGAWVIEHLMEPPTYATSLYDPLSTLSYTAGETETLPVGTSVLLLPLRNPVMVAKRAATIQRLSSRRVTLGLGTGYVEAEFDAANVPYEERSPRYLEAIELLHRLFTEDEVSFEGEFYEVDGVSLEPNLGRPPRILAGGGGVDTDDGRIVAGSVKRRLDHADGWIAAPRPTETVANDWEQFAEYLDSRGRDPDSVAKVALQYLHLEPGDDRDAIRRAQHRAIDGIVGADRTVETAANNWLTGTVSEILEDLRSYERLGFDEVILHPIVADADELDRQLRLYRDRLLPEYP